MSSRDLNVRYLEVKPIDMSKPSFVTYGPTVFNSNVTINSSLHLSSNINVSTDLSVTGNVAIGGNTIITGDLTANKLLTFGDSSENIIGDGSDLIVSSGRDITLDSTSNINLNSTNIVLSNNSNIVLSNNSNIIVSTINGTVIGTQPNQKLSFYGTTPIVQHNTSGELLNFVDNTSLDVVCNESTFTGNTGAKAYTINDIVKALKNVGILASN